MMETFEAVAVVALGLMPGALYLWSIEGVVGGWWLGLSDRLYRFIGWSVGLHIMMAPLSYGLWVHYFREGQWQTASLDLIWLWLALVAYVAVPVTAGQVIGRNWKRGKTWARLFVGDPAPSGWDHVWADVKVAWVRARLKGGGWVGGLYCQSENGPNSYASGFPNTPDLYLAIGAVVDSGSGQWVFDEDGAPQCTDSGILLRWDDVDVVEVIPADKGV